MRWRKYIRPGLLIYFTVFCSVLIVLDSLGIITVKRDFIDILGTLWWVSVAAYTASRGAEKIMKKDDDDRDT